MTAGWRRNARRDLPGGSLKVWDLPFRGYKKSANQAPRNDLVDALQAAAPWLQFGPHESLVRAFDDVLDAVICALVARAVSLGQTEPPHDRATALTEGWIHVPAQPLSELVTRE